jgi:hypothetical protein
MSSATPAPRELALQDLHDTLNSNTAQASAADDSLDSMDDDPLIDSAGKEALGGGQLVGITSTLQDAQVAFAAKTTPVETGTATSADVNGTSLTDTAATFITNGVKRGAMIMNFTDQSLCEVLKVNSETQLDHRPLVEGIANDWGIGDVYKIWNVEQVNIAGGNLVALESDGVTELDPVFPTAFTQVVRTASASATLQELEDLDRVLYQGAIHINAVSGNDANDGKPETPVQTAAAAKALADSLGFTEYHFKGSITLTAAHDRWTFLGASAGSSDTVNLANQSVDESRFESCIIAGDATESKIEAFLCELDNPGNLYGLFRQCGFLNTFKIEATTTQTYVFHLCYSQIAGSGRPTLDFTNSIVTHNVQLRSYSGGLNVANCSNGNLSVDLSSGTVDLKSTVTGGDIVLRGVGNLIDSSTGGTITTSGMVKGTDVDLMRKVVAGGRVEITGTDPSTVTVYEDDLVTVAASWTVSADLRTRTKV